MSRLAIGAALALALTATPLTADAAPVHRYSQNVRAAREWARAHVNRHQWPCLHRLIDNESSWSIHGRGPLTRWGRAYGLGQALPAAKMRSAERPQWGRRWDDWRDDGLVQIAWTVRYARGRYGSMCHALRAQNRLGWF